MQLGRLGTLGGLCSGLQSSFFPPPDELVGSLKRKIKGSFINIAHKDYIVDNVGNHRKKAEARGKLRKDRTLKLTKYPLYDTMDV